MRAKSIRDAIGQTLRRAVVAGTFVANVAAPIIYKMSSISVLGMQGNPKANEPMTIDIELTSLKNSVHLLTSLPLQIAAGKKMRINADLLTLVQTGENTWRASFQIAAPDAGWAAMVETPVHLEIKGRSRTPLRIFVL